MGYNEDIGVFKEYVKNKYGISIKVSEIMTKPTSPREDPRIMKWANAIAEHFGVTVDFLLSKGRKGNSYEKMWFRYMVSEHENISCCMLSKTLGLHHSTVIYGSKVCKGWVEVYPEVYQKLLETAEKHKLVNEASIKIVYENN